MVACIALTAGSPCIAEELGKAWNPVSSTYLDEMRGGFDTGAGLRVSFGILREGYVNGKLVSTTSFNIGNIDRLSTEQMRGINATLVRNGAAGTFGMPSQPAALVIQNTLNQQDIRSLTVINATTNSLDLIRSLNLQSVLTDALAQALRGR
ncbi:MAG: hypothetical protein V7606_1795 [Burkholderiales bacterium]